MYDSHMHSDFSADSHSTMRDMAEAAVSAGLAGIVFTDHFDPDYAVGGWPTTLDFDSYVRSIERVAATFKGRLDVRKGIEIGLQHGATLEKCTAAARSQDYDFIIGSFHCAEGMELSCGDFFAGRTAEEAALAFYRYNLQTLEGYEDFDVLGHINVIDRYAEAIPRPAEWTEPLDQVLRLLVDKGKGVEINTSSFRYKMGEHTTPTADMLKRFRELGGEIVTIGSDAHYPHSVGSHIAWAHGYLRSLGFRYVATFRQRTPVFHKL